MTAITADPSENPARWGWQAAQAAFGLNGAKPREQMLGAAILTLLAYISTALSLGATAVAVVFTSLLFLVGFLRFLWGLIV